LKLIKSNLEGALRCDRFLERCKLPSALARESTFGVEVTDILCFFLHIICSLAAR
jgi:hypothetical protein